MGIVGKNRGIVRMNAEEIAAGRRMWEASGSRENGSRLMPGSFDAERTAPKTWIRYVDKRGEEKCVIECELYMAPRSDGSGQMVGMIHAMCPHCGGTLIIREENKEMSLGYVSYDAAPLWLRIHHRHDLAAKHGLRQGLKLETIGRLPDDHEMMRPPSGSDQIPIVSGTNRIDEPWMCSHCKDWSVYVYAGVARDDELRPTGKRIVSHARAADPEAPQGGVEV